MDTKRLHKDHFVVELYDVDLSVLDNQDSLTARLDTLSEKLGLTVVNKFFHKFNPIGLTGVYVLIESHLAAHTWPEHGYLHLDLFTCSPKVDFSNLGRHIEKTFNPKKYKITEVRY